MRLFPCALIAAIGLAAQPASAKTDRSVATYWKTVQTTCNATAAKPAGALGQRIAQTALDEARHFGGHRIDANGRLFRFGLTEAEQTSDDESGRQEHLGDLGWRQVLKYWQTLYGDNALNILEARGYTDASTSTDDAQAVALLRDDLGPLLRAVENVSEPDAREIAREAVIRSAIIDTPWSAVFISYVIRQSGVAADAFEPTYAHRTYIYDAFAASAAEARGEATQRAYRACPLSTTRPRAGDLICFQRESELADAGEQEVRERIRAELEQSDGKRSVRYAHCEVVAHVDARARKMYTVGGNIANAVTVRQLKLRHGLKFAIAQQGKCRKNDWRLPETAGSPARASHPREQCSLNDRKWFVLLQLR